MTKYLNPLFLAVILTFQISTGPVIAEPEKAVTPPADQAPPPSPPAAAEQLLGKMPELEARVAQYIEAWQKQDFKAMRGFESWEGGDELNEVKYIQSFDSNFKIHTWKITKVEKGENGEYRVLILVSHNPPKQVASMLPPGKTVNSTLIQWWKKQGDQFVHLLHVERKRLLQPSLPQPTQPLPLPPEVPKSS